ARLGLGEPAMSFEPLIERMQQAMTVIASSKTAEGQRSPFGVYLVRETSPTEFEASIYEPVVCLILQGEKETTIGEQTRGVTAGECVVVSHDLPVLARITEASERKPYLAVVIELDLLVLRSLYDEVDHLQLATAAARSMEIAPIDRALEDVVGRYLDLLGDPVSARVLLPLVRKELHFRLFLSKPGGMLRSLIHRD